MVNDQPNHSQGASSRYRAYLIGQRGRIESVVEIVAENDGDAIVQARELARLGEVELWDRSRMIIRLPGEMAR